MQAIEGVPDRPNNSKNSLSLELVQDEVESGACYLVHIRTALKGQTDANAPVVAILFIVQPLHIEYDGASCPLRDSDGDGTPTCKKTWPTQTQTVPHLFQT